MIIKIDKLKTLVKLQGFQTARQTLEFFVASPDCGAHYLQGNSACHPALRLG